MSISVLDRGDLAFRALADRVGPAGGATQSPGSNTSG